MYLTKLKYYFLVLLFLCIACSSSSIKPKPPSGGGNDGSGVEDQDTPTVEPLNITLPEADFTDPRLVAKRKHSKAIIGRLISLIDAAPEGSSIYMSYYGFNEQMYGVFSAIRKADSRGVKLHVMVDNSDRSSNGRTIEKLKAIDKDIDIVGIHNDASSSAINHNKFVLFSSLLKKSGKVKDIVFTTSENLGPHTEIEIQNAVILSNKGLYQAYLHYWEIMKSRAAHGMVNYTFRKYNALKEDGIMAFFYPKRKNGKYYGPDPIVRILDQITDPSSTTIQVEMAFWTHGRIDIVNKLSDLLDQGANLEIVVRSNVTVHDELVDLAERGAYVKMYDYSHVPGVIRVDIHSKVMMIRGEWRGHKTKLVIAGSENYTGNALTHNNENNILLSSYHFKHPKIFKAYEENFNEIKTLPGVCCNTTN